MTTIPDAALGAVIAAIVTSLVTLLGLIISKENKTSEFRQAWIDALRGNIADLIGHADAIVGSVRLGGRSIEAWQEARNDVVGLNRCIASIRLRLNPDEKHSQDISGMLDDLETLFVRVGDLPEDRIVLIEKKLVVEGQKLLKDEWLRVRRGEMFFRSARWFSLAFLSASIVVLIYFYSGRTH
jgi:hypothetical protein